MKNSTFHYTPFNSPLETGLRSVVILSELFPIHIDLQNLVIYDYLVVHTGDFNGPTSLHPKLPMQSSELLVRRGIIEKGLLLMMSRGLVKRHTDRTGITYTAGEFSYTFINSLSSIYIKEINERATWVIEQFNPDTYTKLNTLPGNIFNRWLQEFQQTEKSIHENNR